MPVNVKINKDFGVDIQTAAERDAGKVGVGVDRDVTVDIKPTVGISITNNRLSEYSFDIFANFFLSIWSDDNSFSNVLCLEIISLTFSKGIMFLIVF